MFLQACFSACAKMCVRELRKTDTANVSVFYLSLCSTIGATIGLGWSMLWGSGQGLILPHAWEWALFAGIGNISPYSIYFVSFISSLMKLEWQCKAWWEWHQVD